MRKVRENGEKKRRREKGKQNEVKGEGGEKMRTGAKGREVGGWEMEKKEDKERGKEKGEFVQL